MNKKVIYVAGPITGVSNYWEAFEKAEETLYAEGYLPLIPSRLPGRLEHSKAMKICLAMIDVADAVLFLPGWEKSIGAQTERTYCHYLRKPVAFSIEKLKEMMEVAPCQDR